MANYEKIINEMVEEVASVCDEVEFLHGVPVKLPSQTKALLRGKARKALIQIRQETLDEAVKVIEKEAAETYVEMLGAVIKQQGLEVQDYAVMNTAMIQHILTGTIGNLSTKVFKALQDKK